MKIYSHGVEISYRGLKGQYFHIPLQSGAVEWVFGFVGFFFCLFYSEVQ